MDIQELKLTLSDLNERLNDIKLNVYKIDSKKTRLQEIESQLSQEKVWSNLELSQKLSKEKTALEKTISSYDNVSARLSDCQVLLDVSVEENDDSSFQEIFDETLKLNDLVGKTIQVGNIKLKVNDLCRPCKDLQQRLGKSNIIKEFLRRGGLRCEILSSGTINVGDKISVKA